MLCILIRQIFKMGNSSEREQLRQYAPQLSNYSVSASAPPLTIHRNLYTGEEVMEYRQQFFNTTDLDRRLQTFQGRYQHMYLVAALYLEVERTAYCSGEWEARVFFERVITNLSKVNDIPFQDSLHCLIVALKGFQILYQHFGYFQVFENMFHIVQGGRLKVWCNQHIEKNVPEEYLLGGGNESDMVGKIITIIDDNTDHSKQHYPLKETLMCIPRMSFGNVLAAVRQVCRENGIGIAERLESLQNAAQIENILDIYAPPQQRLPKDTAVTFFPGKMNGGAGKSEGRPSASARRSSGGRGRSLDVSRSGKSQNGGFEVTLNQPQEEFPQFMGNNRGRPGSQWSEPSSSRRMTPPRTASPRRAQMLAVPQETQAHVTGTRRMGDNGGGKLKKKNILTATQGQGPTFESQRAAQPVTPARPTIPEPQERSMTPNRPTPPQRPDMPGMSRPATPQSTSTIPKQQRAVPSPGQVIQYSQVTEQRAASIQGGPSYQQPPPALSRQQAPPPPQQQPVVNSVSPQPLPQHQLQSQPFRYPYAIPQPATPVSPSQPSLPSNSQLHQESTVIHHTNMLGSSVFPQQQQSQHLPQPPQPMRVNQHMQFVQPQPPPQIQQPTIAQRPVPAPQVVFNSDKRSHSMPNRVVATPQAQAQPSFQQHIQPQHQPIRHQTKRSYNLNEPSNPTPTSTQRQPSSNYSSKHNQPPSFIEPAPPTTKSTTPRNPQPQYQFQQLPQLESKVEMVEGFNEHKINTYEFLPNQSHAISHIKFDQIENSGRDSATSAFRREFNELVSRYSKEKLPESRKAETDHENSLNIVDENQCFTNPRLLDMLKSSAKVVNGGAKNGLERRMEKWNKKYGKGSDEVMESSLEWRQQENGYPYGIGKNLPTGKIRYSTQETQQAPSLDSSEMFPSKRKFEKISAISEKWSEQNICSTSNGSRRGMVAGQIDEDILEDMRQEGFGKGIRQLSRQR